MEVVISSSPTESYQIVASIFQSYILDHLDEKCVLGLATGSSPQGVYDELIRRFQFNELSFSHVNAFLLDEYLGLPPDHPQLYARYIRDVFISHLDMPNQNLHYPQVTQLNTGDISTICTDYEKKLRQIGPIGLQILGIGSNGHIGFNEPGSSLGSRTRIKTLSPITRTDNARFFSSEQDVPVHVITQGLGTILESQHIVLIAQGKQKASAIAQMIEGPVTINCPASVLQFHPHVTVVIDPEAASFLSNSSYYQFVQANKPDWQDKY